MLITYFSFIYFLKFNKATTKNHTSNLLKSLYNKKNIIKKYLKRNRQKFYKFYKIVLYIFLKIIFNFIRLFEKFGNAKVKILLFKMNSIL